MAANSLRGLFLSSFLLIVPAFSSPAADLEFLMSLFQGNPSVDGLNGAEEVVVSSDGLFVYVASDSHVGPMGESGAIAIFDLDESAGTIAFNSVVVADGARAIALSPDPANQNVYVAAETTNQILWFTRDAGSGLLSNPGSITGGSPPIGITEPVSVAVSNDGLHVYVVGRDDNSLAVFDRAGDGSLAHFETYFDTPGTAGMDTPVEVRLTPDDMQVIVASQGDDANLGVAFDRVMGALVTPPVAIPALLNGRGVSKAVGISPDGLSVYFGSQTTSAQSPSISVFDRDPMTNTLSSNTLVDEAELSTVVSLAVSPDGRSVIAAADTSDQLRTYVRAGDGTLSFFESIPDGGAIPLDGATSVAITDSGGNTISVAKGGGDDGITLFAPEPTAAALALGVLGALFALRRPQGNGRNA